MCVFKNHFVIFQFILSEQKLHKDEVRKLVRWEAFMAEEFVSQKKQMELLDINEQVSNTGNR